MSAAQDVGIKLRPTATKLTPNDRFVLLTDLLEGWARSQADQLQERMQKELDASNAMELAEYKASLVMHPVRMAEWNALPAEGRGPQPVAPAEEAEVAKTLYRDPLGQFWACLGVCILNGPPASSRSTETLNLCQGSQHPIW
jgi:hypothetical protein